MSEIKAIIIEEENVTEEMMTGETTDVTGKITDKTGTTVEVTATTRTGERRNEETAVPVKTKTTRRSLFKRKIRSTILKRNEKKPPLKRSRKSNPPCSENGPMRNLRSPKSQTLRLLGLVRNIDRRKRNVKEQDQGKETKEETIIQEEIITGSQGPSETTTEEATDTEETSEITTEATTTTTTDRTEECTETPEGLTDHLEETIVMRNETMTVIEEGAIIEITLGTEIGTGTGTATDAETQIEMAIGESMKAIECPLKENTTKKKLFRKRTVK